VPYIELPLYILCIVVPLLTLSYRRGVDMLPVSFGKFGAMSEN
jgi:hypothetical protein